MEGKHHPKDTTFTKKRRKYYFFLSKNSEVLEACVEGIGILRAEFLHNSVQTGLMVAVNEFALASILADLKQQTGAVSQLPEDDPRRQLFNMWHGAASLLHLLTTLCAGLLVALGTGPTSCKPVSEQA